MNASATPNINYLLRHNLRSCKRGAPMGDRDIHLDGDAKLYLQRVRFVDGDYAPDGTYWGGGYGTAPLWCAFNAANADHAPAQGTRIYVRAWSRAGARNQIHAQYPNVRFYR